MTDQLQRAIQLHQQGNLETAFKLYQEVLKSDKKNADAHNLIGAIYVVKKQFKEAEKHLLKATKFAPKFAPCFYNLAKCYFDQGQAKKAVPNLNRAIGLDVGYVDAFFLRANVQIQLGNINDAIKDYKKVLELTPNHVEALNNLGGALQEIDEFEAALDYHRKAIEIAPNFQLARVSLANALQQLDQISDALTELQAANALSETSSIWNRMGTCLQQQGNMDDSRAAYLKAIDLDPSNGAAYRGFANITKMREQTDIEIIQCGFNNQMDQTGVMHLNFAWAKVQDELSNYGEAAKAYKIANQLQRLNFQYRSSDSVALFNTIKKVYSSEFMLTPSPIHDLGEGVIFILGMPRSGTTLVEQIISSHSTVTGAGELENLGYYAKKYEGGPNAFHKKFPSFNADKLQELGQKYVQDLKLLADGKPFVSDKMPHNFLYMGMIAKLLPKAKIVHCKRHPVANCLSIYKAYFSAKRSHPYAYNQKELAEYHNLYEDLMDHWRQVMPDKFYEIKYENLTTNQEEETRKLLEYCGLDWEDACLDFHKTKRQVKTASAFQVRQPMSNKSVGLWKKYGDALNPLIDALYIPIEYRDQ